MYNAIYNFIQYICYHNNNDDTDNSDTNNNSNNNTTFCSTYIEPCALRTPSATERARPAICNHDDYANDNDDSNNTNNATTTTTNHNTNNNNNSTTTTTHDNNNNNNDNNHNNNMSVKHRSDLRPRWPLWLSPWGLHMGAWECLASNGRGAPPGVPHREKHQGHFSLGAFLCLTDYYYYYYYYYYHY